MFQTVSHGLNSEKCFNLHIMPLAQFPKSLQTTNCLFRLTGLAEKNEFDIYSISSKHIK